MTFTALAPPGAAEPEPAPHAEPPAGWAAALGGNVALVVFALTPVFAYFGNLGLAPLVALAGLVALPAAAGRGRPSAAALILLALLAWGLVSLAWSPATPHAFRRPADLESFTGLKLVFELALYGAFVAAAARATRLRARQTLLVLGVGLTGLVLLLLAEAGEGAALYRGVRHALHVRHGADDIRLDLARRNVARATYALAILVWPAALALHDRGWRYATLIAGFGGAAAALALGVDAPVAALAAGGLTLLLVRHGGRAGPWLALAGVLAYFALAPVAMLGLERLGPAHHAAAGLPAGAAAQAAQGIGKASWGVRMDAWRFVADRIGERPLFGWGLDASRTWPGQVPLHPHDGALQLWLELGAPGALAAALLFGVIFAWIAAERERDPAVAGAAAGSAAAYLVIGALSFGIWQEWWLALGALTWAAVLLARCGYGEVAPTGSPPGPRPAMTPL